MCSTASHPEAARDRAAHGLRAPGQAQRLQRISEELNEARQALNERKTIEKAKGILMQSQGLDEDQAYKQLRQAAMDNNKRILDVADNVISVAEMLRLKN